MARCGAEQLLFHAVVVHIISTKMIREDPAFQRTIQCRIRKDQPVLPEKKASILCIFWSDVNIRKISPVPIIRLLSGCTKV
jgi:hypothetical protein